jgi:CDP-diacylglycerol---glycerol-3-phosphate 3-phosphatidyltransferase
VGWFPSAAIIMAIQGVDLDTESGADRSSQLVRRLRSGTWLIGAGCQVVLDRIVRALSLSRIHPNALTSLGLVLNIIAAVLFGQGRFFAAGLVVVGAGIFDMVDGRVARVTNRVTPFGAFFDSVIDRYSDMALYMGLLVYYARGERFFYVVLAAVVMAGSVMISYSRARAESLIPSCKVGFLERPERIVLIIIGALWDRMAPVLWIIAVLSNITVVHRIIYTWQHTRKDAAPAPQ